MPKYKILRNTSQVIQGEDRTKHKVCRLQAQRTIVNNSGEVIAQKGDLGGWVENEKNLSQHGPCWISGEAKVYGEAEVVEAAIVSGASEMSGACSIGGNSRVKGNAFLYNTSLDHDAMIAGNATVRHSFITGSVSVGDEACIHDSKLSGEVMIRNNARLKSVNFTGTGEMSGNTILQSNNIPFSGNRTITGGYWNVAPLYIQGSRHILQIPDTSGRVLVGCSNFPIQYWMSHAREVGIHQGYYEAQIDEYVRYLAGARTWMTENFQQQPRYRVKDCYAHEVHLATYKEVKIEIPTDQTYHFRYVNNSGRPDIHESKVQVFLRDVWCQLNYPSKWEIVYIDPANL